MCDFFNRAPLAPAQPGAQELVGDGERDPATEKVFPKATIPRFQCHSCLFHLKQPSSFCRRTAVICGGRFLKRPPGFQVEAVRISDPKKPLGRSRLFCALREGYGLVGVAWDAGPSPTDAAAWDAGFHQPGRSWPPRSSIFKNRMPRGREA